MLSRPKNDKTNALLCATFSFGALLSSHIGYGQDSRVHQRAHLLQDGQRQGTVIYSNGIHTHRNDDASVQRTMSCCTPANFFNSLLRCATSELTCRYMLSPMIQTTASMSWSTGVRYCVIHSARLRNTDQASLPSKPPPR